MPFTITHLRADIDALLASDVDSATWTEAIKDEGVRQALLAYSLHGPAYEADLVVAVSGHVQDLSVDLVVGNHVVGPSALESGNRLGERSMPGHGGWPWLNAS